MSNTPLPESGQSAPSFNIQRVYLKDLSVEQPNSPDIFLELETPAVEVEINITVSRLAEHIFETVLTLILISTSTAGVSSSRKMSGEFGCSTDKSFKYTRWILKEGADCPDSGRGVLDMNKC